MTSLTRPRTSSTAIPTLASPRAYRLSSVEGIQRAGSDLTPTLREASLFYTTRVQAGLDQDVVGHHNQKALMILGAACFGHMYLLAAPGTAKTRLSRSLAANLGLSYGWLPCTPETQASDVTGWGFFNQASNRYEFAPGPILNRFCQIDEVNRQQNAYSGMLQAMENHKVTVDNQTYDVLAPGIVVATANPYDRGTYPPADSFLDRMLLNIHFDYLDDPVDQLELILNQARYDAEVDTYPHEFELEGDPQVKSMVERSAAMLLRYREAIRDEVVLRPNIASYITDIFGLLRSHQAVDRGASLRDDLKDGGGGDRALVALVRAAKAHAVLCGGRAHVEPDDIQAMAQPVLAHRLVLAGQRPDPAFIQASRVVAEALERAEVPAGMPVPESRR